MGVRVETELLGLCLVATDWVIMRVSPRTPRHCVLAMYDGGLLRASRRVEVDLDLVSRRQRLDAHTKTKYKMGRKCEYLRWARKANTDKSQTGSTTRRGRVR